MNPPAVVSPEEWLTARRALLVLEKNITRAQDELAARRRALPWVKITREYEFTGPEGPLSLADLFQGKSQLIIHHFMFGPGWQEGCVGCSFLADHTDSANQHLMQHDVSLVTVSRATFPEIAAFKARMGWQFPWVSSYSSDFNYDFHVSFTPEQRSAGTTMVNYAFQDPGIEEISGHSVFYRAGDGTIYHTYSTFSRGGELLINTYNHLDLTPKGRNEQGPAYNLTDWVRHHDRYDLAGHVDQSGRFHAESEGQTCGCGKEAAA